MSISIHSEALPQEIERTSNLPNGRVFDFFCQCGNRSMMGPELNSGRPGGYCCRWTNTAKLASNSNLYPTRCVMLMPISIHNDAPPQETERTRNLPSGRVPDCFCHRCNRRMIGPELNSGRPGGLCCSWIITAKLASYSNVPHPRCHADADQHP